MNTAAFIASLPAAAALHGPAWALDEIDGWRDAERADPQPMTPDEQAALAVAECEWRRLAEARR